MRCAVGHWPRSLLWFSEWDDAVLRIQGGLGLGFILTEKRPLIVAYLALLTLAFLERPRARARVFAVGAEALLL